MSTTDDARLDALDRRGRAAARTLLDDLALRAGPEADASVAIAGAVRGSTPSDALTATEPAPDPGAGPVAGPVEPSGETVIDLRPPARGAGRAARRMFLAAAAVAILGALATVLAIVTDDGTPNVSSGGPLDYILPGWLPEGFQPLTATTPPDASAFGFRSDVAVYGDREADDPWSSAVAVVHIAADEGLLDDQDSDGETVTVAGHDATLQQAESEGFPGWSSGRGLQVEWPVDDGRLLVVSALGRDDVLAAAEGATAEPAIDPSALPDGYTELARGPMEEPSLLYTSLFEELTDDSAGGPGLAVAYADPSASASVRPTIVVAERPGPESAVDLLRLSFEDADEAAVRGHHAMVGRGSEPPGSAGENGVVAVQWAAREGQLATVVGFGVAEDEVLRVAEGLRPASPGEVAELRDQSAIAAPREFGEPTAGHVVVTSGETPTGQWRLVADAGRDANIGALTVDRMSGKLAATSSNTGERVEPPIDVGADVSDGTVVMWGVLWVDAASLTVEGPGGEPLELGIHEVEGWDHPAVAGAFPVDHFDDSSNGVVVVARDSSGREIARNTTVLAP